MYEPQISTAEQIARGVAAAKGGAVRRTGTGYECRCPAHDDHDPSLSVSDGQSGPLVHCHAGCSQESVISALRDMGLWHARPRAKVEPMRPKGIPSAWHGMPFARVYPYTTQTGEIVGYVARYEDGNGGKEPIPFFQREGDRWKAGAAAAPRPLYGLPSLAKAGPVYVVEGEKSADALIRRGHACVTNQGGAKAAKKADWKPLAGRDVILWPDYDAPGVQHAKDCRAMLRGIASSVRTVDVQAMDPDKEGWDAADWDGVGNIPLVDEAPAPRTASDNGSVKPHYGNAFRLLSTDERIRGHYRMNEFTNEVEVDGKPVSDVEDVNVCIQMCMETDAKFTPDMVGKVLTSIAFAHAFHPVREYLQSLHWDGTPRIDRWLSDAFEVEATAYSMAVGKNTLIGAVARVMRPGCQMDTMLILEGEQGIGKTRAVRALAGQDWYCETIEKPGTKDFYQSLRGMWIVEMGELDSLRKSDVTRVKQVLSSTADNYRPSFGKRSVSFPRQNIFIGTTNETHYLIDPTGARRFWPVKCLSSNVDYIQAMRDQLWAEALHRFQKGEPWHEVPEDEAREQQDARYDADSLEDIVGAWVRNPETELTGFSMTDVLIKALNLETWQHSRQMQTRVGHILTRLGYLSKQETVGGVRVRLYRRKRCTTS